MHGQNLQRAALSGPDHFLKHGFAVIDTPAPCAQVLDSFNHLPRDGCHPKYLRRIRLSQYFVYWEEGQWILAQLPQRPYIPSAQYLRRDAAGGVAGQHEPLQCDPSSVVSDVLEALPIERHQLYQVDVAQIRATANAESAGVTVPLGPHRDGHRYCAIVVAARHNVRGGETQVMDPHTHEILHARMLGANQAVLIDDERRVHHTTDIVPAQGDAGHRDAWVIRVNAWDRRAYGPAHERRAGQAPSTGAGAA